MCDFSVRTEPSFTVELSLQLSIREVPGSSVGLDTEYPLFSSVDQHNCWDSTLK
jgi:hypothetical protein